MKPAIRPASSRWAVLILLATSVALASCGRKGGLDAPPHAAGQADQGAAVAASSVPAVNSGVVGPLNTPEPGLEVPRGQKRSFVLDPLLD